MAIALPEPGSLSETLLPRLSGACLAVRERLGPGQPRERLAAELIRELGLRGFRQIRARNFWRGRLEPAGSAFRKEDCFDLVVEARSVIEFARPASPAEAARQLSAFEDRLIRLGWEEGLMVDFDCTDPWDGLWIAKNPADWLASDPGDRLGTN